jgi:protein-S-isoprenylcysteine O-methyltransferase Ste14
MSKNAHFDPCPQSAVSHGVGLVGLAGLFIWTAIAWHYDMDGPHAGVAAVVACGVPMVLWSIFVDKVHLRPSTGIDWNRAPRSLKEHADISIVKLVGLWVTWGGIAAFYFLARWYWTGNYPYAMSLFMVAGPALVVLSIPYVFWLDRRLVEPRDASYAFGQWVLGSGAGTPAPGEVAKHVRAWAVKGFFLAFMLSIEPSNFIGVIEWRNQDMFASPPAFAAFMFTLLFMVDVAMATVGYVLTLKPLDAHIRSANPLLAGWVAALMCYPPIVLMGNGGPLDYHEGTAEWTYWLEGHDTLIAIWAGVLVLLTGIYAWATVAFGLRFSNLTNRGVITHGPYRWTRHPAYLSKNLFWWLTILPFLNTSGNWVDALRNCALLAVTSGVYYWRARTEEAHLSEEPDYVAYSAWMARNGAVTRLLAALTGKRDTSSGSVGSVQPAE